MKKTYVTMEISVEHLNTADIITASGGKDPFKKDVEWDNSGAF